MTTQPDLGIVHVDAALDARLDDGRILPVRTGIGASLTSTLGLVVFPVLTGWFDFDESRWTVTHAPSGRYIPVEFPDQAGATAFAEALAPLADWTQDKPAMQGEDVVRIGLELGGTVGPRVLKAYARKIDTSPKES